MTKGMNLQNEVKDRRDDVKGTDRCVDDEGQLDPRGKLAAAAK